VPIEEEDQIIYFYLFIIYVSIRTAALFLYRTQNTFKTQLLTGAVELHGMPARLQSCLYCGHTEHDVEC
jgi:hypothetical protein